MRLALIKLACLVYESLILIAIAMLTTLLFISILGDATVYPKKFYLQLSLWLMIGFYFVWQWSSTGQTLAMKTWQLQITSPTNQVISKQTAVKRYLIATCCLGLGFIWALFDKDGQSLQDRLANTRIRKSSIS